MGPRLSLLVTRLQGALAVQDLAPALGLPPAAEPLASLLLTIAIAIVLDHTFLSPSLTRVAPHARRTRHHATPYCTRHTIEPQSIPTFRPVSTSFRPLPIHVCDYIVWQRLGVSVSPGRRRGVWPRLKGAPFTMPDVSTTLRFARRDNWEGRQKDQSHAELASLAISVDFAPAAAIMTDG